MSLKSDKLKRKKEKKQERIEIEENKHQSEITMFIIYRDTSKVFSEIDQSVRESLNQRFLHFY